MAGKAAFLLWSFDSNRDNYDDHYGNFRCKQGRIRFEFTSRMPPSRCGGLIYGP